VKAGDHPSTWAIGLTDGAPAGFTTTCPSAGAALSRPRGVWDRTVTTGVGVQVEARKLATTFLEPGHTTQSVGVAARIEAFWLGREGGEPIPQRRGDSWRSNPTVKGVGKMMTVVGEDGVRSDSRTRSPSTHSFLRASSNTGFAWR
jgi:hypothetical protein